MSPEKASQIAACMYPPANSTKSALRAAFTLIELSVVLVIIGLIVGGVLVGQDLVRAAGVRATISQIEKYNAAANTFYGKYGFLPGDIPDPAASSFGFEARGQYLGEGDGNGQIEGIGNPDTVNTQHCGAYQLGEPTMFWVDLSQARLIDGGFNTARTTPPGNFVDSPDLFFPAAKLGQGNYVYVWSGGYSLGPGNIATCLLGGDRMNYFGIAGMQQGVFNSSAITTQVSLTVQQSYNIDKKVDDGLPQSGNVLAIYINSYTVPWAAGAGNSGAAGAGNTPTTASTPGSSTTCYDNGNVAGATQQYSVEISNGSNVNCALSFKMQAGSR